MNWPLWWRLVTRGDLKDPVLVRAAERLLEIIGEASSGVSEETRLLLPGVDWRRVTRLRIVLAHHYHRVDPDLVWTYSAEDAPRLAVVVAAFLERLSP